MELVQAYVAKRKNIRYPRQTLVPNFHYEANQISLRNDSVSANFHFQHLEIQKNRNDYPFPYYRFEGPVETIITIHIPFKSEFLINNFLSGEVTMVAEHFTVKGYIDSLSVNCFMDRENYTEMIFRTYEEINFL